MATPDEQKIRVVRVAFAEEYNAATAAFSASPNGDNFNRLKDAMYAYQYSRSHLNEDELIAMYNHHPVGQWLPMVTTRIKAECQAANVNY